MFHIVNKTVNEFQILAAKSMLKVILNTTLAAEPKTTTVQLEFTQTLKEKLNCFCNNFESRKFFLNFRTNIQSHNQCDQSFQNQSLIRIVEIQPLLLMTTTTRQQKCGLMRQRAVLKISNLFPKIHSSYGLTL